jgi:hypothetical protein
MDQFCYLCNAPAKRLCDGKTESGDCDRPMCMLHTHEASVFIACVKGKGRQSFTGSKDYCKECQKKRSKPEKPLSDWQSGHIDYYDRLIEKLMHSGLKEKAKEHPNEALQSMRRSEIKRLRLMKKELLERRDS